MNKNNLIFHAFKIRTYSEKLFETLDKKLDPKAYVFLIEKKARGNNIYLEPQAKDNFAFEIYENLSKVIKESMFDFSDMVSEFELQSILDSYFHTFDKKRKRITYISNIYSNEDYYIAIFIQLNAKRYSQYPKLAHYKTSAFKHLSLLDFAIERFLNLSINHLIHLIYNLGSIVEDHNLEKQILNWSANVLMNSIYQKIHGNDSIINAVLINDENLFENCNIISSLLYEGRECKGTILISAKKHSSIKELLTLKEPIPLNNHRIIRKLMEISYKDNCLLYSDGKIYATGKIKGKYNKKKENLFRIVFNSHFSWVLYNGEDELMASSYGIPKLTDKVIDDDLSRTKIGKVFSGIKGSKIRKILDLIDSASKQKHGTIIVISEEGESEALRLKKQAIVFDPFVLNKENLINVTNIDGAVILDEDLKCYAAGVILDGKATDAGSTARGARYNSAVRYIKSQKKPAMAIVVSEDGMIDLVM